MEYKNILECEYTPSLFSNRFKTREEVLKSHCEFITKETNLIRQKVKCTLNVSYNSGPRAKLDIYHNNLPKNAPLFVYIHGGYWQELNKDMSGFCVRPLVNQGYKVIIVGYDLCPQITLEQLVEQIKSAGRFIMQYAVDNGSRFVSFAGHSAGAHLASFLFTQEFCDSIPNFITIKSFYLIAGIYDLTELRNLECANKDNILLLNEQNVKTLSPIQNIQQFRKVNIKIIVGDHDTPKFQQQSQDFYEQLKNSITTVEFKLMENYDHFNVVEDLAKDDYTVTQFIRNDIIKLK